MASGGARNRSGPQADPKSGRSDQRKLSFDELPSEGREGEPPTEWPLSDPQVYIETVSDSGKPIKNLDIDASEQRKDAELALWAEVWTYPQAVAWEREPWRWNIIAIWVRTFLTASGPEAKAADKTALHRFGDQIGLTPAGLRENGWQIVRDEVASRRQESTEAPSTEPRKRRLRAVGDER
ncbi:hypothetical protein FH975_05300 [Nesterenkonia sp. Hz 6-5]|nr:hypothetical protein [Nesterenkonia haasae]